MRKIIKKIKKNRWHKHAAISALIALVFNIFVVEGTYSPLIPALASGFVLGFVGVFWEAIHEIRTGDKLDWSKVAANFVGAFVIVYLYHWIF